MRYVYKNGVRSVEKNYNIISAKVSKVGNRKCNEDSMTELSDERRCVYAVADGLGGQGNGDIASKTAMDAIEEVIAEADIAEGADFLENAFFKAQQRVLEKKNSGEYGDMMTTMSILSIDDVITWAHVGDSRIYYFENGKIVDHTDDHSVPQALVYAEEIAFEDIRNHPDRNKLLRAIGKEWNRKEYTISENYPIKGNQVFLLCTDGFWEFILEKDMEALLDLSGSPSQWLDAMERVVVNNGKGKDMDNYTAIAVWIN